MEFPELILPKEWQEIADAPGLRQLWNLSEYVDGVTLSAYAFGARFYFDMRERDAYAGDIFIVQRVALDDPPIMLLRDRQGKLRMVNHARGESLSKRPWGLAA